MLTQERLKELFYYCEKTGCLKWHKKELSKFNTVHDCNAWNVRFADTMAGCLNKNGYYEVRISNKKYPIHGLIWILFYGKKPKHGVDHKNTIRTCNFIENLREANKSQNGQNRKSPNKNNKTGLLGVSFNKNTNKFRAQIMIDGKQKHIGLFDKEQEAHQAYIKAKRELHPFGML